MADCHSCASELADGAKFCKTCGTPAVAATANCPSCGTSVDGGHFCSECGASLTAAAAPPPQSPVAERRITSVLFGDLVGFTPLSESRDAEEIRELLARYFAECRTVIGRYGGTIEKFIGDAVMAVWGVPVAHEDDAERAVRAGLELATTIAGLGDDVGAPGLAMRVGIVTGEVAVTVGATADCMVAGDTVNTAARVQTAAAPGQVWVDDSTRSLTAASVAFEDVGVHELKGKAEPMRLFAARAIVGEVGGGGRVEGLEAPLTGRDREVRLLKEMFHGAEESGRPRLVVLDGEAGIGKSRIAWEFEKYADGLPATTRWHRGRCLSYGDGVAFWALAEAVRTRLGLTEGDTGEVVDAKLEAGLEAFVPDEEERSWLRPRLAVLVSTELGAEFTRSELFVAWTSWFERVGQGDTVVLVIDDAQHADDGLLDFLDHLLATSNKAIFVLALARPELLARRPSLGGRRATVMRLDPLDDDAMSRLVDGLVAGLTPAGRAALVERAEGVPLFAVETVRALIDRDSVVPREGRYMPADGATLDLDALGAPASLQALVAARLDSLTPDERRVVAVASVLGATCTRAGLVALSGDDSGIDDALESLQRKEILSVQQDRFAADRGQFRFVQTVVRQVSYSMQSRRDRRLRHLAAASHLSSVAEGSELALVIAQHLLDAVDASATGDTDVPELTARACNLLVQAAYRARSLGSSAEARRLFESAGGHAVDLGDRARLSYESGRSAVDAGDYVDGLGMLRSASEQYDALECPIDAGLAAGWQALTHLNINDVSACALVAQTWWDRLEGVPGAEEALIRLSAALASAAISRGDHSTALDYANRRLRYAEASGRKSEIARSLLTVGAIYARTGAAETSRTLVDGAARLARQGDQLDVLSNCLNNLASLQLSRDLVEAEQSAREGIEVARRWGVAAILDYTTLNLVAALWNAGRLEDAAKIADAAMPEVSLRMLRNAMRGLRFRVAEARGEPVPELPDREDSEDAIFQVDRLDLEIQQALHDRDIALAARLADTMLPKLVDAMSIDDDFVTAWPLLVRAALMSGDLALVDRMLAPVEGAAGGGLSPGVRAEWHWFRGAAAALRGDDPACVEAEFRDGIERLDEFGARGMAAQAREDLGRWLVDQGRAAEAEPLLTAARSTYGDIGAAGWLANLDAWQREPASVV
jgi:class 3 adenylate cyclase/tetratricopeptide (TPR) repeat protein